MATQVISFANNKGGSGKTTSCSNIGYALSLMGKHVLVIDGDMQMNLTLAFLGEDEALFYAQSKQNLYYAIKNDTNLSSCVIQTDYDNLDLIPSSTLMSSLEYELYKKNENKFVLRNVLQDVIKSEKYDYILIDAPPTLGIWVMNILLVSDWVIIPVEASPWGLFGLANMIDFIEETKDGNSKPELMGVLITKVNTRKKYFKETQETLEELDDIPSFKTIIRVDSQIEWAQDVGEPVLAYKRSSRSAKEYYEAAEEVIQYGSR